MRISPCSDMHFTYGPPMRHACRYPRNRCLARWSNIPPYSPPRNESAHVYRLPSAGRLGIVGAVTAVSILCVARACIRI